MDITKITKPARKLLKLKKCGAVILAAGSASRMGGIDKVLYPLLNLETIGYSLLAFDKAKCSEIYVDIVNNRLNAWLDETPTVIEASESEEV